MSEANFNQEILNLKNELLSAIGEIGQKVDKIDRQLQGDGINAGIGARVQILEQKAERLEELRKLETRIDDLMEFKKNHEDFQRSVMLKLLGAVVAGGSAVGAGFHFFG
jgi:hypothetical protein